MAWIIRVDCTDELDTFYEDGTPHPLFVCEREGGQGLTSERFATVYPAAGHASAVASEFDGRLIAKYGRRCYEIEVVPQ